MVIVALAGRRIDAQDAELARFPLENAPLVRERIRALLVENEVQVVVSAAACGADLLALEVAGELGLRRRIILPFARDRFRELSVTDRPGDWGVRFDVVCTDVAARGDLVELTGLGGAAQATFEATNRAILDEAQSLAHADERDVAPPIQQSVVAVLVWDGKSRGDGDLTDQFGREARARGLKLLEVQTR